MHDWFKPCDGEHDLAPPIAPALPEAFGVDGTVFVRLGCWWEVPTVARNSACNVPAIPYEVYCTERVADGRTFDIAIFQINDIKQQIEPLNVMEVLGRVQADHVVVESGEQEEAEG